MLGWRSGNDDFGGPDYCLGSAHRAWFLLCMNVSSLSNEPLCRYYGPCLTDEETRSEKYRNLTVITEKIRGLCTILELEASVYRSRLGNASWTWLPFVLALNDGGGVNIIFISNEIIFNLTRSILKVVFLVGRFQDEGERCQGTWSQVCPCLFVSS